MHEPDRLFLSARDERFEGDGFNRVLHLNGTVSTLFAFSKTMPIKCVLTSPDAPRASGLRRLWRRLAPGIDVEHSKESTQHRARMSSGGKDGCDAVFRQGAAYATCGCGVIRVSTDTLGIRFGGRDRIYL